MASDRSYHIRWPGLLYIVITVLLGVGAINSQNNLLFIVFGLALGALLVSGVVSGAMLMGVTVHRRPVHDAAVGSPLSVVYQVRNANRLVPALALTVHEDARVALASERPGGGDTLRVAAFVTRVPARRTVRVRTHATPARRGVVRFEAITVTATFPLGVFRKSVVFREGGHAMATPAPAGCRPELVLRGPDRRPRDQRQTPRHGAGDEFYALRDYVPGDPTRMIAWKPSARADTLVVRQNLAITDTSLELTLVPDAPAGSARPGEPAERTLSLAMGLAEASLRTGRSVSVLVSGAWSGPVLVESRADLARLAAGLAELDTLAPAPVADPRTPPSSRELRVRLSDPSPLEAGAVAAPGAAP
jgi:uncharacterized protein (DUF58 family)